MIHGKIVLFIREKGAFTMKDRQRDLLELVLDIILLIGGIVLSVLFFVFTDKYLLGFVFILLAAQSVIRLWNMYKKNQNGKSDQ